MVVDTMRGSAHYICCCLRLLLLSVFYFLVRKKKPPSPAPVTPTASVQSGHTPNVQSRPTTHVAGVTCKLPGCTRSCFSEPGGKTHEFCGKTHAGKFKELQGMQHGRNHIIAWVTIIMFLL